MPKSTEESVIDDSLNAGKFVMGLVFFGVLALVLLIVFFTSWYTIDAGDRGIVLTFGKASPDISQPGMHFKIPLVQSVVVYSVRTQTISFDNKQSSGTSSEYTSLAAASKDLQNVQIGTVVNYHINEKDVLNIYQQYGDPHSYEVNILEPIIRNTVKATSAHYNANDLIEKRSEVVAEAQAKLSQDFADKNAVLDNLNLVNFEYSAEYSKAIEEKVTAQQNALTEQNKLAAVQFQAQQRIAQAKGEAEAIQIQAAAIQSQGGAAYVELQRIQKWNGNLPLVVGGSSIMDMRGMSSLIGNSS